MPKPINATLANLLGGISRQANSMRFANQLEDQVNCLSDLDVGLRDRPPAEVAEKISSSSFTNPPFFDLWETSDGKRWWVIVDGDTPTVSIYDATGVTTATVTETSSFSYLSTSNPARQSIRSVVFGDSMLLCNREQTCAMRTVTIPTYRTPFIVRIDSVFDGDQFRIDASDGSSSYYAKFTANESSTPQTMAEVLATWLANNYAVSITSVVVGYNYTLSITEAGITYSAAYTAVAGDAEEDILNELRDDILASTSGNFRGIFVNGTGSAARLYVMKRSTLTAFTTAAANIGTLLNSAIEDTDFNGEYISIPKLADNAVVDASGPMTVTADTINSINDLPSKHINGYRITVSGSADSARDDYIVIASPVIAGRALNWPQDVYYKETLDYGEEYDLDGSTMPHLLTYSGSGSFEFTRPTWDQRQVGTSTTNPDPSFIGRKINNMIVYRNRLVFLAGPYMIASRIDDYYNFWRRTITDLLPDDPIDALYSDQYSGELLEAAQLQGDLLLFGTEMQVAILASEPFTPTDFAMGGVGRYPMNTLIEPRSIGSAVRFLSAGANSAHHMEMQRGNGYMAFDRSDHVSDLIPASARHLAVSGMRQAASVCNDTNTIWIHQWAYGQQGLAQNAHHKWVFATGDKVLSTAWLGDMMSMLIDRGDGVYIETINTARDHIDYNSTATAASKPWLMHLDRRVSEGGWSTVVDTRTGTVHIVNPFSALTVSYDSGTDITTVTLPYTVRSDDTVLAVVRDEDTTYPHGWIIPQAADHTTTTVYLSGDHSSTKFWIGITYERNWTPGKLYLRDRQGLSIDTGRTLVRRFRLHYENSAYVKITVSANNRDDNVAVFDQYELTGPGFPADTLQFSDGHLDAPVNMPNDEITITVSNDTPVAGVATYADWTGSLYQRVRRI